jgi:hypothetical protein
MELPPDFHAHMDADLFVWRPRGVLTEKTVNTIIRFLGEQEAGFDKPFNRFSDTTLLEALELNFQYVFHVALYRRLTYAGRPKARSAFLINNEKAAHYFKLHALLADHSALQVRTFEERPAAAKWLGVSEDLLENV